MADTTLGEVLKADTRGVPRSFLMYACAGLVGAVTLTALEQATKIDKLVTPPTIEAPKLIGLDPVVTSEQKSLNLNEMPRTTGATGTLDKLREARFNAIATSTTTVFLLDQLKWIETERLAKNVFYDTDFEQTSEAQAYRPRSVPAR